MTAREELAVELGIAGDRARGVPRPAIDKALHDDPALRVTYITQNAHLADALLASPALATLQAETLAPVAAWLADKIGFPIEVAMPNAQPPAALWEAVVDHIHTDTTGSWHGNQLTREDTDSWLRDEAGMPNPTTTP